MIFAILGIYALFNIAYALLLNRRYVKMEEHLRVTQLRQELQEARCKRDTEDCRAAISELDCEFMKIREGFEEFERRANEMEVAQNERQEAADRAAQAFTDGVASILSYDLNTAMKHEGVR